jgi:hypothetical protein
MAFAPMTLFATELFTAWSSPLAFDATFCWTQLKEFRSVLTDLAPIPRSQNRRRSLEIKILSATIGCSNYPVEHFL